MRPPKRPKLAESAEDDADLQYLQGVLGLSVEELKEEMLANEGEDFVDLLDVADRIAEGRGMEHESGSEERSEGSEERSDEGSEGSEEGSEGSDEETKCSGAAGNEAPSAYVPPHKRRVVVEHSSVLGAMTAVVQERGIKVVGLINRLSEGNLDPIMKDFLTLYKLVWKDAAVNKRADKPENEALAEAKQIGTDLLSKAVAQAALNSCVVHRQSTVALISVQTCLMGGLSALVGQAVLANFMQLNAEALATNLTKALACEQDSCQTSEATDSRQFCRSSIMATCLLFDYGVLTAKPIFGLVRRVAGDGDLTEFKVDCLLTLLRFCGSRLRGEFPTDFTAIMKFINDKMAACQEVGSRFEFLKSELASVKKISGTERFVGMRDWLRLSPHMRGVNLDVLDVEWDALENKTTTIRRSGHRVALDGDEDVNPLLVLAEKFKMRTDIQKSCFVAVMGAEDVPDAVQRLLEAGADKQKMPTAIAVLLHVCLSEKTYNPFYFQLIKSLCGLPGGIRKRFSHTIKQGVCAQLGTMNEFPPRKATSFASLVAALVLENIVDLRVIRFAGLATCTENLDMASGPVGVFLRDLLVRLIQETPRDAFESTIEDLCSGVRKYTDICEILRTILDSSVSEVLGSDPRLQVFEEVLLRV
ncbi:MAG: hypothetical protein KVP17_003199 [Porospora cf. gigantea B]|uniref:uncharacterized protein n=1 Tax=Porospora cf. gigantea B TaxID=2853592 RepID=UPI003571A136|nr:MAG: hypothetical protein KVP17_003199 [Porospora cf. gigantea B]